MLFRSDVGADQFDGGRVANRPLTLANVGPSYLGGPPAGASAPTITVQPTGFTAKAGDSRSLTVEVSGSPAPVFQWSKDGAAIAGATNATLSFPALTMSQAGSYAVTVANSAGITSSAAVVVGVNSAVRIINLSVLTSLADPSESATLGYVVGNASATSPLPVVIRATEDDPTVQGPRTIHPPKGGTVLRIAELQPESAEIRNLSPEKAREVFAAAGNANAAQFGKGGRHPMMHRTESLDYAVVLEGEITLVLDDQDIVLKAGDVCVQRGNNHSWSNRSGKVVRMLYVLIDGRFDPELKALLDKGGGH